MNFLQVVRDIAPIAPEPILTVAGFPIANSSLLIFLIIILLLVVRFTVLRSFTMRPSTGQNVFEILYESILSFIQQITGDRKHAENLFSIIGTMFVFLGISNLIGLVPGITAFTVGDVPLFRTPTADFNTTFTMAAGSIIVLQFVSLKDYGFFGYVGKYFKFKEIVQGFRQGIKEGFIAFIDFFVGILDIVGEIAKIISLSLRLFGNMYAGEVLAVIIMGGIAWVVPSIWTAMNVLVGVIQALVFGSLVAAYYMLSIKPKEVENVK